MFNPRFAKDMGWHSHCEQLNLIFIETKCPSLILSVQLGCHRATSPNNFCLANPCVCVHSNFRTMMIEYEENNAKRRKPSYDPYRTLTKLISSWWYIYIYIEHHPPLGKHGSMMIHDAHLRQRTAREFSILRPEMTLDTSLSEAFFCPCAEGKYKRIQKEDVRLPIPWRHVRLPCCDWRDPSGFWDLNPTVTAQSFSYLWIFERINPPLFGRTSLWKG